jgi:pro-kumamolisin-like protein/Big-like domain-containing protein/subtilase family protein
MVPSRFSLVKGALLSLSIATSLGISGAAQTQSAVRPLITGPVNESSLVTLRGNVHPLARREFDRGRVPVSLEALRMMLLLKRAPRQQMMLEQYLASLEDKNSPDFHRFLTPEQFGQQYGPAPEDVAQVVSWLSGRGFSVNKVAKSRMAIEFSGSVNQVERAFHTEIHQFAIGGQQHVANITNPMIPSALAPVVAGVSPLNDFHPRPQAIHGTGGRWNAAEKRFVPELTVSITGSPYLFMGPGDAATIYDAPTSLNTHLKPGQTNYDGSGVTIGIATDGGVNLSNVANYRSLFKMPTGAISVVMDGNSPGGADDTEATLDGELAGAIAPGAKIVYYQAADTTFQSGVMLAILRALDDNAVNILNVSYGACELAQGAAGNQEILNAWQQAAAQGIAVTVSSGDSGSADCDDANTQTVASQGFGVNGLASTPYTVAVGGTDFDVLAKNFSTYVSATNNGDYTSALGYIPETTWNDSTLGNGSSRDNQASQDANGNKNIVAGGGGASSGGLYDASGKVLGGYPKPAWQQQFQATAGIAADKVRDVPDVSMFAANGMYGSLWATCGDNDCSGANPTISGVGGTSASAPAFAGVLALINQRLNQKLGASERLGQPNWVLYQLAKTHPEAFHPIQSGNNAVVCAPGTSDCAANGFLRGYDAGGSYNPATGLGSVDISSLVNNWTSVGKIQTTAALTLSSMTFQHGQPIAVSVDVDPPAATGNVAISNDLSARGLFSGSSQLNLPLSNGVATGSWAGFPGGTYNVYAEYGGDANYGGSISGPTEITVTPEDSVLELSVTAADANGQLSSLAGKTVIYGTYISVDAQPIGISQVASPSPVTNATGTVAFTDSNPSGTVGSGMLDAVGNAEFPSHSLAPGTHTISASYWGDNSYNPSTSASVTFTVQKAGTSTSLTSSVNSISSGTLAVTAVVRPSVAGSYAQFPNGTVTFTDKASGAVLGTSGGLTVMRDSASGLYVSTGSANVPVSELTLGSNSIVATYNGDANFAASAASAPAVVACTAGCGNGTGQALSLSFTRNTPASATNPAGTPSTAVVSVTPAGGFTGAVNLTCSVTGAHSNDVKIPTCSFTPAAVTITNTLSVQSTLTVTTTAGGTTAAANALRDHTGSAVRGGAMLACLLCFGIRGRRRALTALSILLCGFALGGMAACGGIGGSGSAPATSGIAATGTTPDTYTVTFRAVDASTGTLTAQDSFTMSVN